MDMEKKLKYIRTINSFKLLLSALFLAIFMVPFLLVILIFFIYRTLVYIILKFKYRSTFDGIMNGVDAYAASDSKNIINVIMIAKTENTFEEFYSKFKEAVNRKIFQNTRTDPKFLSTRHKLYGYHYLIHDQVEIDECVRSINFYREKEEINKNEFTKAINDYCEKTLPYNNAGFWEILLCENPVKWDDDIDKTKKSYAILLRFHHSLADGITLMKFIFSTFSDSSEEIKSETLPNQNNFVDKVVNFIYILLMGPIVAASQYLFKHKDVLPLNDEQIMFVKTEKSRKCLNVIKRIRKKIPGTHFMDILAVAISKSFSNYFQKKGKHPNFSNKIISNITMLMDSAPHNLQFIKENTIKLRNTFSLGELKIPIIQNANAVSSDWESFVATLKKIKIENDNTKIWLDAKVVYEVFKVFTYFFPEFIFLLLIRYSDIPLLISNVPGSPKVTLFDDCHVEYLFCWVPRPPQFGSTLGFLTYDERLQIALNVNKGIISDELDAQDIVEGIYQALILLDDSI